MQTLAKNQEQIRSYFQNTFGGMFPFGTTLEEMSKQNLAMFERAMRMFSPFSTSADGSLKPGSMGPVASKEDMQEKAEEDAFKPSSNITPMPTPATTQASSTSVSGEEVQTKIAALQRQLADLAKNKG